MAWFAHDTGIVPAAGQREGYVGVGERLYLEDGRPGRDMILDRADCKDRFASIMKRPSARSLSRYSLRKYSECIAKGIRVPSAFQAIRSFKAGCSPIR